MKALAGLIVGALLAFTVGPALFLGLLDAPGPAAPGPPAASALADIPPRFLELYVAAAVTCPGLRWEVVAAVGKVETDHGRATAVSSAGARGPMQFLPQTWAVYGVDADGDGRADIDNPTDAIFGAAKYLCASGGGEPARLPAAIYAYNHSAAYVADVLTIARRYAANPASLPDPASLATRRSTP